MFIELVVQVVGKCQSVMHVPSFAVLLKYWSYFVVLQISKRDEAFLTFVSCSICSQFRKCFGFHVELFFSILDFCYGGADCDPLAYSVSQKSLCSLRVHLVRGRDRIRWNGT
ncbi:hypothetical protein ACOSQ3_031610 [Xanthoceras sorbifolium]